MITEEEASLRPIAMGHYLVNVNPFIKFKQLFQYYGSPNFCPGHTNLTHKSYNEMLCQMLQKRRYTVLLQCADLSGGCVMWWKESDFEVRFRFVF